MNTQHITLLLLTTLAVHLTPQTALADSPPQPHTQYPACLCNAATQERTLPAIGVIDTIESFSNGQQRVSIRIERATTRTVYSTEGPIQFAPEDIIFGTLNPTPLTQRGLCDAEYPDVQVNQRVLGLWTATQCDIYDQCVRDCEPQNPGVCSYRCDDNLDTCIQNNNDNSWTLITADDDRNLPIEYEQGYIHLFPTSSFPLELLERNARCTQNLTSYTFYRFHDGSGHNFVTCSQSPPQTPTPPCPALLLTTILLFAPLIRRRHNTPPKG